jgi:riboflavin kinase/FMN adenylyltransferase
MVHQYTSLDGVNIGNTWLTIGSFDGVHIGHQQLIGELINNAHQAGGKSVVLTFHPHPAVILRGRTGAFYLTPPPEKTKLLDELGADIVITHPFTYELSQSSAREYITYLMDHLGFHQLWVGYDFALGKGREGNVPYLKLLGEEFGYTVHIVDPVTSDGKIVSSSLIRNLLSGGEVANANKLLARSYRVEGIVVHGDGRGKRIGIPTANLETGDEKLIPDTGVYACMAQIQGKYWLAAVNVGTRPTFEDTDQKSHVEAHILDFSSELYGQEIALEFIERLRGEIRYQSVEELIKQIYTDITQTRVIIGSINRTQI